MNPLRVVYAMIFRRAQNEDVPVGCGISGGEEFASPFLGRPEVERLRVEDRHGSAIEQICHDADAIAQVIERGRIFDESAKHRHIRRGFGGVCHLRRFFGREFPTATTEVLMEPRLLPIAVVLHEFQTFGHRRRTVLLPIDRHAQIELPKDRVTDERIVATGCKVRSKNTTSLLRE